MFEDVLMFVIRGKFCVNIGVTYRWINPATEGLKHAQIAASPVHYTRYVQEGYLIQANSLSSLLYTKHCFFVGLTDRSSRQRIVIARRTLQHPYLQNKKIIFTLILFIFTPNINLLLAVTNMLIF